VTIPRETWTELQRAETLLFRAAAVRRPDAFHALFDGFEVEGAARNLLIRAGSGFPADALRPADYLARYPFSTVGAIRALLEELVESGVAEEAADGAFALTERGVRLVETWMHRIAAMMTDLDLGDVSPSDVEALIAFDRRIVESLRASRRPHGSPVLSSRLRGVRPDDSAPGALWHHWQRVWTILAASEDEEEHVRRGRGIGPLVWFVRRQLWFIDRRPWRARARTLEGLIARALGYAPVERPEEACVAALDRLVESGEVEASDEGARLTVRGLAACDEDELEVDTNLLARWPAWSEREIERLRGIVARLNARLLELARVEQGGSKR
jgi:hypothetical protein